MRRTAFFAAAIALSCVGCADLRDLNALMGGLTKEFSGPVGLNLQNDSVLTLTFQNSPLAAREGAARDSLCREIGGYVRDHYPHFARLTSIRVAFATSRQIGPLSTTSTDAPCVVRPADLGKAMPAATSRKAAATAAAR